MRKTICQLTLVMSAAVMSCSVPPAGGGALPPEGAPTAPDIASQPVHYPFTAPGEVEPPEAETPPVVETAELPPTEVPAPEPPPLEAPPALEVPPAIESPAEPPTHAARELEQAVRDVKSEEQPVRPPRTPPRYLTLRESIESALSGNLKLKQQEEAIAEAEARLREKQNEYGPRLQFDYTIWTEKGIFVSPVVADPDIPAEGTGRAELTLLLPVWMARRGREAAVKQAMQEIKVRREDYDLKRNDVVAEVIKRYFEVLETGESLRNAREIHDLNRRRLATLRILRERGQILKNRLLLGEKFMAAAGEELKYREAERVLAESRLRKLLRLPESEAIVLDAHAVTLPEVPTTRDARDRMRTGNPVLRRLYHERLSAYWTGQVRRYEEPRANIAIRYGASFPEYERFTDDFVTVGLSVNWPVAKVRLDRAKRDQARHRVRQLELEEDIVSDELDLDLIETHAAYLKSLRRLEARRLDVSLAEENLRLSRVFRRHGTTDSQEPEDVFQVQVNAIALAEARMEYAKVKYEALGLLADLYHRMGVMDELVRDLAEEPAVGPAAPQE